MFIYCNSAPAGCFAIFRNIFIEIGGYDNFFDPNGAGEDREFALRMMLNGYAIFYNCNAKLFHLEAGKGGRKSVSKYPTLFFKKNTAYTIYKHLGSFECKLFIMREIYFRMKLVVKFKMPRTQLRFIMKLYRSVDFKKFDSEAIIPDETIELLKHAFNLTASSYGLQPVKLLIVSNKSTLNDLVPLSMNQKQ